MNSHSHTFDRALLKHLEHRYGPAFAQWVMDRLP